MKKSLYERICSAIDADDSSTSKELMEGYSPAKMRIAYKVIEEYEGYTAACAAKRGEHTFYGYKFLGLA